MSDEEQAIEAGAKPTKITHDMIHKDIALGNSYRLEVSKLLLVLTTGLFAFSVAFPPAVTEGTDKTVLLIAWSLLALSMTGGILNLYLWEKFYLSYLDYDYKGKRAEGQAYRKTITLWRRISRSFQFAGFFIGAALMAWFTWTNLSYTPPLQAESQSIAN